VVALSGDESVLIVRGTHSELVDGEVTVVSQFVVVDVVSGQLVGSVGPPCRGVAPASAEFVANTRILLVTCEISTRHAAGPCDLATVNNLLTYLYAVVQH